MLDVGSADVQEEAAGEVKRRRPPLERWVGSAPPPNAGREGRRTDAAHDAPALQRDSGWIVIFPERLSVARAAGETLTRA
jgi:hypothetical protein